MNVVVEILQQDPALGDLGSSVQGVLRVGMASDPSRSIPSSGDVLYLMGMDLTVVKAVHDWDSPESPTVIVIAYPDVPIGEVKETLSQIETWMRRRASQNLDSVITWVTRDWG